MDLNEINIFVRVIQAGAFGQAARSLGMPKSTVSTKIRSLETRLGVALITRTTRKLQLTEAGRSYFDRCLRALESLQAAEAEATHSQNEPQGQLRVTAPLELGYQHLTPLLQKFLKAHPGIQIELILTDDLVDLVGSSVDVAIRAGELDDSSFRARKIGESTFKLFASPGYLQSAARLRSLDDLAQHHCLHFTSPSTSPVWTLQRRTEKRKIAVNARLASNHVLQLKTLAIKGAGIVLLPSFLATDEVKEGTLIPVLPEWHGEQSPVHVLHPASSFAPPKVELFVRFLHENFKLT